MPVVRRTGTDNAFWNNTATGAGGFSNAVHLPEWTNKLAVYLNAGAATVVTLQAAHSGNPTTAEDVLSNAVDTATWAAVTYLGTALTFTFAGSGKAVWLIPDFVPGWVRLASSNSVTMTAGFEAIGN